MVLCPCRMQVTISYANKLFADWWYIVWFLWYVILSTNLSLLWSSKSLFSSPVHEVIMSSYSYLSVVVRQLLACEQSRGHSFSPIIIKLAQNDHLDNIWSSSYMGYVGSKTRSVGQIIEKPCQHSRGHSFGSIFIKLAQNDHLDNISVKFEYGWCWVKN